jgi:hypothetical protein
MTRPGFLNPGRRGGKPTTNRLSSGNNGLEGIGRCDLDPEEKVSMYIQNVGNHLQNYMVSESRGA